MNEVKIPIVEFQEFVDKYKELLSLYNNLIAFEEHERRRKILFNRRMKKSDIYT